MAGILLVTDEKGTARIISTVLKTEGYKIAEVSGSESGVAQARANDFNLLIVDASGYKPADMARIKAVRSEKPSLPVIIIAEVGQDLSPLSEKEVFATVRKPLRMDDLVIKVQLASDYNDKAVAEMTQMRSGVESACQFDRIVAASPAMRGVCDMISRISATDVTVLLSGESGTGKSLVARTIHNQSRRSARAYATVDCKKPMEKVTAEIFGQGDKAGVIETATGGTVFFAEVDNLPVQLQGRLLKSLQERRLSRLDGGQEIPFDIRILASSRNPDASVQAGSLNPDLYRTLKSISISIPPLRERGQDIKALVSQILQGEASGRDSVPRVDAGALAVLEGYSWPGNVRELEKVVRQCLLSLKDGRIAVESLPETIRRN